MSTSERRASPCRRRSWRSALALVLAAVFSSSAARAADEVAEPTPAEPFVEDANPFDVPVLDEMPLLQADGAPFDLDPPAEEVPGEEGPFEPAADEPAPREVPAELGRRDLEAIERLFENGLRAMFRQQLPAAVAPAVPANVARERRRQVEQQAKQMEQFFQPTLQTELEMIRQSCAGLSPEVRREILAAGRQAVGRTALEFAARQMNGNLDRRQFDPRQSIRAPLAALVKQHAAAEEFAAYEREQALRQTRREAAARIRIVAKLDRQLDLSAAQREAIAADLERNWESSWIRELDDQGGMVINNYRPAPDFAHASIAPHLDAAQRAEWTRWRQAAGSQLVGRHMGWNFDGQGLQQPDAWWGRDK